MKKSAPSTAIVLLVVGVGGAARPAVADTSTPAATASTDTTVDPGSRALVFQFTPTGHAQIAMWIEKADGTFVATIRLTQAVGYTASATGRAPRK